MASLRDRLRAAAGMPTVPRTTPSALRALLRRRRRRRRAAVLAVSAVVVAGAGTGVALIVESQRTQTIEFAEAPSVTTGVVASEQLTSASESGRQESEASAEASLPAAAEPSKPSEPPEDADRTAPRPASPACEGSADAGDIPASATAKQIVDVDGDDRRDALWLDRDRDLGIITAAGGSARVEIRSAAPNRIGALAVNADRRGPVELLVSDGRSAQLFVFDDCDIRPVINTRDGKPWLFDRGFRGAGTGVGCVAVDGQRKLVGLNIEKRGRDTVEWSRTVVDLDGRSATAGRTDEGSFDSPRNDLAIELLSQITCGDLTMVDDGVHAPAPQ